MTVSPAALHRLGGEGPPVLLVHGFGADRYGWAANAHALMGDAHRLGRGPARPRERRERRGRREPGGARAAASPRRVEALPGALPVVGAFAGRGGGAAPCPAVPGAFDRLILIAPAGLGTAIDAEFLDRFPTLAPQEDAEALLARLVAKPGSWRRWRRTS